MLVHHEKKMKILNWPFFYILFLILILSQSPVNAQDFETRLRRIEADLDTLNRAVYQGDEQAKSSIQSDKIDRSEAKLQVRLQNIEQEMRELTGKIEESEFSLKKQISEQQNVINSLQEKLRQIELQMKTASISQNAGHENILTNQPLLTRDADMRSSLNMGAGSSVQPLRAEDKVIQSAANVTDGGNTLGTLTQPALKPVPEGAQILGTVDAGTASNTPTDLYEQAFSLLKKADYDGAEKAFSAFIRDYPEHNLASNAHYWLGESFYVRGDYKQAARTFASAYQTYPESTKGPDNLLKLGLSLAAMEKKEEACVALQQIKKEYPSGVVPILSRAEQEMKKLGCAAL